MNSYDPDPNAANNCLAATLLSLILAVGLALLADLATQQNALSNTFGALAVICIISTFVLGIKTYTLYFPKPPAPPAPLPPDEIVDWQTTDDVLAYPACTTDGEQKKVVVHISFMKQTTAKNQATTLLRTQLCIQRAINEYFLEADDIDYSGLDAVLQTWVLPLAQSENIQIYVRTVNIT
jgi:hypothetical protein